ncbi:MAG: nucleotidyltransferase family protein, partial [Nitrospirae bacterium]
WLSAQGITRVWINLHYRADEIRAAVGDGARFGVQVRYVHEPEILGTAGAVRNLDSEWTDTFLVVYGDNLLYLDLQAFFRFHRRHRPMVSVALFDQRRHPHTGIAGGRVTLEPDGRIKAFGEGGSNGNSSLVNAGVYLLEPAVVDDIPPGRLYDFGRDLFPALLAKGSAMYGYVITGYCLGIDTPESYHEAVRLVESGEVNLS